MQRGLMLHLDEEGLELASLLRGAPGLRVVMFAGRSEYEAVGQLAESVADEVLVWRDVADLLAGDVAVFAERHGLVLVPSAALVSMLGAAEELKGYRGPMACRESVGSLASCLGGQGCLVFTWIWSRGGWLLAGSTVNVGGVFVPVSALPQGRPRVDRYAPFLVTVECGGRVCHAPCLARGFSLNRLEQLYGSREEAVGAVLDAIEPLFSRGREKTSGGL